MINKLYHFKGIQLEQQIMRKRQVLSKVFEIDEKIEKTKISLSTATVKVFGSIGDFKILAMHKNSMKFEIAKFEREKKILQVELVEFDRVIMELQKELEQYGYILKEEMQKKLQKEAKNDEVLASEYIQSKWMAS